MAGGRRIAFSKMCADLTLFLVLFTVLTSKFIVKCDNFPSLISTNATLAIVIDRDYIDYIGEKYENIKDAIEEYMKYAKREILKSGGVYVEEYAWTAINVKRGRYTFPDDKTCTYVSFMTLFFVSIIK